MGKRLSQLRSLSLACVGLAMVMLCAPAWGSNVELSGTVGYNYTGSVGVLTADKVQNKTSGGTSGTLHLELWAFPTPYNGTAQTGYKMAFHSLGQLAGGFQLTGISSGSIPFVSPPNGSWAVVMVLTEFDNGSTNGGYSVRDYINFSNPLVIGVPQTAIAVEYRHAAFDHYFVTAIPDEITKLDNGTFVGWTRTGQTFKVYTSLQTGLAGVCRFFSTAFAPKSSHFYTPDAAECSTVQVNPNWQFEAVVFYMAKADASGNCPSGTQPVYRVYNNGQGAAPNHRYMTSLAIRSTMLGQNWIPEGYGPVGVIMCAPL